MSSVTAIQAGALNFNLFTINSQNADGTPLQSPSGSISMLDLKAPGKAQHEYDKGFRLLMNKDAQGAIEHLTKATEFYPKYVAAFNALGTAYLNLNQNEQARDQFAKAVSLDEHLPNSYLNLGIAHLALKETAEAEGAFQKASSIAPLDKQLSMALAYGEFANHDYDAVIETARQVHEKKHKGVEVVHFFAAGAQGAKNNLAEAQHEMETLLQEDPKSPSAEQFRQILDGIKAEQAVQAEAKLHPPELQKMTFTAGAGQTTDEGARQAQQALQNLKQRSQIAEAEAAAESACSDCGTVVAVNAAPSANHSKVNFGGPILRTTVEEVGIFFAATNHGKSVTDLTEADVELHDDNGAPEKIRGFRNESQLPLRLGLIIDTSESITNRFSFEQKAATRFIEGVVTDKNDQAFVIGVNNSVLLVQDFTADQTLTTRAINQLAPGGGTSLWDAVGFAADKLAALRETQPVARVLVVISDGKDNSSSATLKEAIDSSLRGEIAIYTVSTRDLSDDSASDMIGDAALKTLAELTGGAAFVPGSLRRLTGALADVQQVIRGRYLISYKPANFDHDGRYRKVEIKAQKDGRPIKVYARKGYYAAAAQPAVSAQ
jgi:Ca-activated chloride channel family protein